MELFNAVSAVESGSETAKAVVKEGVETIVQLLTPFVPHVTHELWQELGLQDASLETAWPVYSEEALTEEQLLIVVQVNGKIRGKITVPAEVTQDYIEKSALKDPKVIGFIDGKTVRRVVYVPRRLVNIVVEG